LLEIINKDIFLLESSVSKFKPLHQVWKNPLKRKKQQSTFTDATQCKCSHIMSNEDGHIKIKMTFSFTWGTRLDLLPVVYRPSCNVSTSISRNRTLSEYLVQVTVTNTIHTLQDNRYNKIQIICSTWKYSSQLQPNSLKSIIQLQR